MDSLIYVIGVKEGKITERSISMKIMDLPTIIKFFSEIPVNPPVDVDKIEKELHNGGVSFAKVLNVYYKLYTSEYVDAHDMNWTLKSYRKN